MTLSGEKVDASQSFFDIFMNGDLTLFNVTAAQLNWPTSPDTPFFNLKYSDLCQDDTR